ncbi:MAG: hypothetical protein QM752_02390 [Gammaproteobacteria bacterium]
MFFEAAAVNGPEEPADAHPHAFLFLAKCYFEGIWLPKDTALGIEYREKAGAAFEKALETQEHNPEAQYYLGLCYYYGYPEFKDSDFKQAIEYFVKAAKAGHVEAMINLAVCYARGEGIKQADPSAAKQWYQQAQKSEKPDSKAVDVFFPDLSKASSCLETSEFIPNFFDRVQAEVKAILRGLNMSEDLTLSEEIQNLLYFTAESNRDSGLSLSYLFISAVSGHIPSQLEIAQRLNARHAHGNKFSMMWAYIAAEKGSSEAQYALTTQSIAGAPLTQDEAYSSLHLAARQKYPKALFDLAIQEGHKGKKQSLYWAEQAALQGLPEAQLWLMECSNRGDEIPIDDDQAFSCALAYLEGTKNYPVSDTILSTQLFVAECYRVGQGVKSNLDAACGYYYGLMHSIAQFDILEQQHILTKAHALYGLAECLKSLGAKLESSQKFKEAAQEYEKYQNQRKKEQMTPDKDANLKIYECDENIRRLSKKVRKDDKSTVTSLVSSGGPSMFAPASSTSTESTPKPDEIKKKKKRKNDDSGQVTAPQKKK